METNLKSIDLNTIESEIKNDESKFPIDAFPELFRDLITELNETQNFPNDYTGTAILTAIATAIGTSAKVKVKGTWHELPALYTSLIGNAGANKTHPVKLLFEVFNEIDNDAINKYKILYNEFEEYQSISKKTKDLTPKIDRPILIKTLLTNFTPEILNQRLNDNVKGCTVLSDELSTFLEGMNNYSKSDQTSVYLSFWSNQPTSIDRVGNPIPLFIKHPYLSIIGGLQPRMLKQGFPIQKTNNGFLQRFLFAFPNTSLKHAINDNEFNTNLLNRYNEFIKNYIKENPVKINEENGQINSKVFYWSADAKAYFYKWQKENCDLVNNNQNTLKGEIISKYDNHFIRLALILQIMENQNTYEIGLNAVKGADELCKYFMNCAFKVLSVIQDLKTYTDALPKNKKDLYNELTPTFTTETAINLGANYSIADRTVKEFIKDTLLFERVKHGVYNKITKA
jgi:hypothetical protein